MVIKVEEMQILLPTQAIRACKQYLSEIWHARVQVKRIRNKLILVRSRKAMILNIKLERRSIRLIFSMEMTRRLRAMIAVQMKT